ncbi:helix-turn-helix transcriptional regulator [Flavobacterium reichenbachii]|uniref:helix-turn-helix transcriptional regulator n=1 Tax=Flavobacterium reichenbachii TaxID=362418 RepID=UPI001969B0C4|nr:helix-turn-helix transcriptional regulator [Flavobacterium reichenbachii]
MDHQQFESPEELKSAIKCFWYNKSNFRELESSFEVIPDGYCEIIFYFGSSLSISYNGELKSLPSPFMIGLLDKPVTFFTKKNIQILGIRCYPWTVYDLLKLPSDKKGVQLFEHPISMLQTTLNEFIEAKKILEAIEYLKNYFITARSDFFTDTTLVKAGSAMRASNGTIPVSQVAEAAHATVRTLERKFKQSSGHTVKDISALIRFEQARNQLLIDPFSNLARLASELGYTDQSHLSREFKRYSGTTPAAFAREAKKNGGI